MRRIAFCGVWSTFFAFSVQAQTVILDEDFQQGIPGDWTIAIKDTFTVNNDVAAFAPGWISVADPDNTTDTVAGATSYFTVPGKADRWLITPPLTLGAYGNYVTWNARSHDPSWQDGYYVMVSTTTTDSASFTDTIAAIGFEDSEWISRSINLSNEGYDNQTIHIAFRIRSYDAFKLYIDDVQVRKDDPVGIAEQEMPQVVIYPNPASGQISVLAEDALSLRILSTSGQEVLSANLNDSVPVSIGHLPAGLYVVAVTTENGVAYKRLVKE